MIVRNLRRVYNNAMIRPTALRSLRVLLLAAVLVAAQWLLVQHEVQIDAHAAHTACEWCLAHAPLGGALPSSGLAVPPPVRAYIDTAAPDFVVVSVSPSAYSPRAPPRFLPA